MSGHDGPARAEVAPPEIESGAVRFARYAYPPNHLGYCGPSDPQALLGAASSGGGLQELTALAPRFEGAWPYLRLIAAGSGIEDPLDLRVVSAYWLGSPLLGRIPPRLLLSSLDDRFEQRARADFAAIAGAALAGGVAHHSFHVFAVYPWLGLLRHGMEGPPLEVLDRCRIRSGKVVAVEGDSVLVRNRVLEFLGERLVLGAERTELARWGAGGLSLVRDLRPGDTVSLHWDWVCDRLSALEERRLTAITERNLRAVNSLPRPGPSVACDLRG